MICIEREREREIFLPRQQAPRLPVNSGMEKGSQLTSESRELMVKRSFKQGIHGILTACSKQDFAKAFHRFTESEQDALYRIFVEVISCSHKNILAGDAFETVEQVLEEQSLDPLFSEKTNVVDVWQDMTELKKKEIQHLKNVLQTLRSESMGSGHGGLTH